MARLPQPGADNGAWGDILNEFLGVAHNVDGTLNTSIVKSAGAEMTSSKGQANGYAALDTSGSVPSQQLANSVQSFNGRIGGVAPQSGDYTASMITGGLVRVGTTGGSGFALQNATPTILSWTAPSDNQLHTVFFSYRVIVTSIETGGAVRIIDQATGNYFSIDGGSSGVSDSAFTKYLPVHYVLLPGKTITLTQYSALTSGAATVYAELWAS